MAVKIFNREGLRRDFNLSDLTAPQTALNNILATPTMLGTNDSFTINDLLPITQIYVTNITSGTFNSLNGVSVTFTVIDENGVINNATNPKVYRPLIKVKNRLDTAYFSTGEPFFFGGDGPNATYYDAERIVRDPESVVIGKIYEDNNIVLSNNKLYRSSLEATTITLLTHTSGTVSGFEYVTDYDPETIFLNEEFDVITGEKTTITNNFWERGQFIYGNKVQSSFISLFGGVGWQGFFKPIVSGISRFYLRTTGSTIFKFQDPSSQSFQSLRYGKVDAAELSSDGTLQNNSTQWQRINNAVSDSTRQIVEVQLEEPLLLKNDDVLYIEVLEGPLVPRQYDIFTYNDTPALISKFFIEVTIDFNRKNININDLDTPSSAGDTNISGYRGIARYLPYDRRELKTYLNSIYHKLTFISGNWTPTGTRTFTVNDFEYYHVMINDYIYDYRQRSNDLVQGVRRWIVTNVNDNTKQVTVKLDTEYIIDESDYNDQQAYLGLDNTIVFSDTGTEIDTVYTTGNINDSLLPGAGNTLYFVGRYGDATPRIKYITIEQFLEQYIDYAFDWLYYTKDSDIDPTTQNKAWILWYRAETAGGFSPLNYKYLYDKNYEFYQIGDFKTFLDNSVSAGGTSRDDGIDQRAFGKKQLDVKGDQYNTLFSLLPVKSEYSPPVRWNQVTLNRTVTITNESRLVSFNNGTDIQPGNYIFLNNNESFSIGSNLPYRTRINEVLNASNSIISSRNAIASQSVSGFVLDHRGFVTSLVAKAKGDVNGANNIFVHPEYPIGTAKFSHGNFTLVDTNSTSPTTNLTNINNTSSSTSGSYTAPVPYTSTFTWTSDANGISFTGPGIGQIFEWEGTGDEIQEGMVFVSDKDSNNQQYYRRVVEARPLDSNGTQKLFLNTPYTDFTSGTDIRAAIYYDRGVDIIKPLETFCTGTACAQNKYEGENAVTEHIGLFIGKGVITGNDQRFTNPQNGVQVQIQNSAAKVSYWRDYQTNIQTEGFITAKTYKSNAVYARLNGTALGAELAGLGHDNFPLDDYIPIGYIEGMIRITGEIWDGENENIKTATTGFSGSVANESDFTITLDNVDNLQSGSYVTVNGRYCEIIYPNPDTGVTTIRNKSGATRTFSVPDNSTLTFRNQIYYFIVRVADRWQSLTDFDTTADGISVGKVLDFTKFPSSSFDLQYLAFPTRQDQYYIDAGDISNLATLQSRFISFNSYADRFFEITSDITILAADLANFINPTSFAPLTGTTYVIPSGSYIHFSTRAGNKMVWFKSFEDFQGDYSAYSLHPTTPHQGNTTGSLNNLGNLKNQNLISMNPTNSAAGQVLPSGSADPLDMPFQFLHYRRNQYELLPLPYTFNQTFPFLRLINPLTKTEDVINGVPIKVEKTLQNTVNKLSVFTFANDLDNKELCCPPLDTSPPFDSSPIGLSTTANEPDMSSDGLVNVRSLSGNHPESKIHGIPNGQSLTSLPVDKKFEISFGGITYDLLISDSKPF